MLPGGGFAQAGRTGPQFKLRSVFWRWSDPYRFLLLLFGFMQQLAGACNFFPVG